MIGDLIQEAVGSNAMRLILALIFAALVLGQIGFLAWALWGFR